MGMYYERLDQRVNATWLNGLTEYVPSKRASNLYKMIGMVPQLEEENGPAEAQGLIVNEYELRNKKFGARLRIPEEDLDRDETGQLVTRISDFTKRPISHWMKLCSTLIENGESGVCYTGQPFFSASHVEGDSGTYRNLITYSQVGALEVSSTTAPTPYEFANAILALIPLFYAFKDDKGEPRNEMARKFLVMVPVGLMGPAFSAATQPVLYTGSGTVNNPLINDRFQVEVDVNPRLTWTDSFTIAITDGDLKPLIRQEEKATSLVVFGPESEYFELHDEALIRIKTRRNAGYGTPWQMLKATFH